jgi:DNA helicase-2/ATP-dependent DNA helicase PcrA
MSKKLTDEQKMIARHVNGHALVKAVPGSGKTTTLVMRITYLLKQGFYPNNILILMYNKAAQLNFEGKLHIAVQKANFVSSPEVRTFHSYAKKLVKQAEYLKLIKPKILTEQKPRVYQSVLKASYAYGYGLEDGYIENNKIEELVHNISNWRSEDLTPSDLESDPTYEDVDVKDKQAYAKYFELMDQHCLRTFDDLLIEAVQLIKSGNLKPPTLHHIVVDEYQDVNFIQNEFIKCLTKNNTSVMVVGDVNQCIYEWRGSRPDFIEGKFQKDFKNTTLFNLSCTFRYGHQLSFIANSVISKNKDTVPSMCISHPNNQCTEVHVHQGIELLNLIKRLESNRGTKTNAIIARANADLIEPEIILQFLGIPYRNMSNTSTLITRPEISLLTVLFCIAIDGSLEKIRSHKHFKVILRSFIHQINFKLAKGQLQRLTDSIANDKDSFWEILKTQIDKKQRGNAKLLETLGNFNKAFPEADSASTLYQLLDRSDLFKDVSEASILRRESNDQVRGINFIQQLLSSFKISAEKLLQILVEPSTYENGEVHYELSTMHGSKGLEWHSVIILGLHDKAYPGQSKEKPIGNAVVPAEKSKERELKEDRRLFYVAITRAISQLHLVVPQDSQLEHWHKQGWSSTPKKEVDATRFVFELDLKQSQALMDSIKNGTSSEVTERKSRRYLNDLCKI